MADALPTKTEIPQFDIYPAKSVSKDSSASPQNTTYMPGTSGSTGALPGNHLLERGTIVERAAQVGGAVGRAVATVRRRRGKLVVMKSRARNAMSAENLASKGDEIRSSARNLANTAQRRASELTEEAQNKARELAKDAQLRFSELTDGARLRTAELKEVARERAFEVSERAVESFHGIRLSVQGYINENPLQALAIIGGTAAVLGATFRVVRSRNAERM